MYQYTSLRHRLRWAEALLWPILACHGAIVVIQVLAILMMGGLVPQLPGGWDGYQIALYAVVALVVLFTLGAVATFVRWQRQAARNLHVLTGGPVDYGVGWATWGWFVPFANLLVPMRFFHEQASKSSVGRQDPDLGSLVNLWWCLFLGSRVLDRISRWLIESAVLETQLLALGFGVAAAGTSVLAGFFVIVLLRHVTERQDASWAQLNEAAIV